jgi:hypothetical protein
VPGSNCPMLLPAHPRGLRGALTEYGPRFKQLSHDTGLALSRGDAFGPAVLLAHFLRHAGIADDQSRDRGIALRHRCFRSSPEHVERRHHQQGEPLAQIVVACNAIINNDNEIFRLLKAIYYHIIMSDIEDKEKGPTWTGLESGQRRQVQGLLDYEDELPPRHRQKVFEGGQQQVVEGLEALGRLPDGSGPLLGPTRATRPRADRAHAEEAAQAVGAGVKVMAPGRHLGRAVAPLEARRVQGQLAQEKGLTRLHHALLEARPVLQAARVEAEDAPTGS